ncbi:MAG: PEP-CTERM sorting domain-containing protein [bacterium]|nr:PEP-CTERM sorting domain-containing protein [bacterium]
MQCWSKVPPSAAAFLVCAFIATTAPAGTIVIGDAVVLSDLLGGGTLTVGDKDFSGFTYAYTGDSPPADGVNVIPIQDQYDNYGIRFQGGFIDLPGSGASDVLITYDVTATRPGFQISDAHITANPNVIGTGLMAITETFLPLYDNVLLEVFDLEPGPMQLTDQVVFPVPVNVGVALPVQKDIFLFAEDANSLATMSFVDQTFSQVPEPGSIILLAALTLGAARRRRSA